MAPSVLGVARPVLGSCGLPGPGSDSSALQLNGEARSYESVAQGKGGPMVAIGGLRYDDNIGSRNGWCGLPFHGLDGAQSTGKYVQISMGENLSEDEYVGFETPCGAPAARTSVTRTRCGRYFLVHSNIDPAYL